MHKHSPCHERFLVGMVLMVLHLTHDFTYLPREAWALLSSSQIPHGAVGSLTSSFSILRVASLDCSWWYRTSSSVWTGCWALTWHTCRNDSHHLRWPRPRPRRNRGRPHQRPHPQLRKQAWEGCATRPRPHSPSWATAGPARSQAPPSHSSRLWSVCPAHDGSLLTGHVK